MSIYFRNTPVSAPFMFESLGNHWNQVNIFRPDGYPYYHYLQTEKGTGRIEVRGKFYTLGANEGILIAPGVPHSYHRESTSWTTMFATFTGTLAGSIPSMTDNQEVILIEKEQGASIRKMISSTLRKYHQPTPDMKSLSSDCYNFLMNFTDCAASPKIQDNPLYQRYVIPVSAGYHCSATEPERFCLSAVSFPSVPPFYGLLGLRVRYHVPHQPRT